jgi:hypothetical protein
MNRLNGWQRLFVVIAVLWVVVVYFYGNRLQGNYLSEIRADYYVAIELKKLSATELKKPEVFDRYAPYPYRDVIMSDGVVVSAHIDYHEAKVQNAYDNAQSAVNAARRDALQDYLIKTAKNYFSCHCWRCTFLVGLLVGFVEGLRNHRVVSNAHTPNRMRGIPLVKSTRASLLCWYDGSATSLLMTRLSLI